MMNQVAAAARIEHHTFGLTYGAGFVAAAQRERARWIAMRVDDGEQESSRAEPHRVSDGA
jgi:hypothetical protein